LQIDSNLWSQDQDHKLRKLAAAGTSMAEIAEQIGRTKSAIRVRAAKLKIAIARDRNPMQGIRRKTFNDETAAAVSSVGHGSTDSEFP
jgi:hypothetical protein